MRSISAPTGAPMLQKGYLAMSDLVQHWLDAKKNLRPGPFQQIDGMHVRPIYAVHEHQIEDLVLEILLLRSAVEQWNSAVRIDVLMEGPRYMGVEPSRGQRAWEYSRALLERKTR